MDNRTHARDWQQRRTVEEPRQAARSASQREEEAEDELLPINRSHIGCPGVKRMRKRGWSQERIRQAVIDWLVKPIPRTNRLNGYRAQLGLASRQDRRLIHYLTPEQLEKAHSIFRHICEKHKHSLERYPKRRGVYWACAVSRVRATRTYEKERRTRNYLKRINITKIVFSGPKVENPMKALERRNYAGNYALHRSLDAFEAQMNG